MHNVRRGESYRLDGFNKSFLILLFWNAEKFYADSPQHCRYNNQQFLIKVELEKINFLFLNFTQFI